MANKLSTENSLYLKQHANNPVNWYPWGNEALEKAKIENKPIIVSIGYSSCHWCHVMAHECFEDNYIADLMNKNFICIKVDREERPDLDQIYMEAVQMIQQNGGWPLNVFCMPDGKPFFGGTYFPPEDRGHGIIPWPQLLIRICEHYQKSPNELEENANNICLNLAQGNDFISDSTFQNEWLLDAAKAICKTHDEEQGGFGEAPKFPPSMTLNFLLAVRYTKACENKARLTKNIDIAVENTLTKVALSGLFDQIGGGFARYSVDAQWKIPHFEKMLYDNALLLSTYTRGWLQYKNPLYKAIIHETVDWLKAEMLCPNGGFAASIDADSEGKEGKYYVWLPAEIIEVLGKEKGEKFCEAYSITEQGNFEEGTSNPILSSDDMELRNELKASRIKLLAHRKKRIAPSKDPKQMTSWMSLLACKLIEAGFYLNQKDWIEMAQEILDLIWDKTLFNKNRLHSILYQDNPKLNGYLNDYAYYAEACLGLASKIDSIKPGKSSEYIERAKVIIDSVLKHFKDDEKPGFYFTSDDHETLAARKKEWFDNALPSSNSSLLHSLSILYALTGEAQYADNFKNLKNALCSLAQKAPNAIAYALEGITHDALKTPLIKTGSKETLQSIAEKLKEKPWRRCFLMYENSIKDSNVIQLCIGTQCNEENLESLIKKI